MILINLSASSGAKQTQNETAVDVSTCQLCSDVFFFKVLVRRSFERKTIFGFENI